jgi:hypothetical protein
MPGKNEPWPAAHGRLTIHLQPSDIILFRTVNEKCFLADVLAGNKELS